MFNKITKEKHYQLLQTNELYKSIWTQIEYIEDYLLPFISLDEIYPELSILVHFGLESKRITDKYFFYKVINCLGKITKLIEEKCRHFHHNNLDLSEEKSKQIISKLTSIINKYEVELDDVTGKADFNGRILPIIQTIEDRNPMLFHWNLVRLEFAASIVLSTKRYYQGIISSLKDNLELNPKFKESNLVNILIKSCKKIQGLAKAIDQDEKSRTAVLSSFIDNFFIAKDESSWGVSQSSIKIGEPDIKIENTSGEVISIVEGINLSYFDKKIIKEHIDKIYGYDANGSEFNFFIVFYTGTNFEKSWETYKIKIKKLELRFPIAKLEQLEFQQKNGLVKICKSEHFNSSSSMYHIYLKMTN